MKLVELMPINKLTPTKKMTKVNESSSTIGVESWDSGDYVVTIGGAPIGQSLMKRDADTIAKWLKTAIDEIKKLK